MRVLPQQCAKPRIKIKALSKAHESDVVILMVNWTAVGSLTSTPTEATTPRPCRAPRIKPLGNLTYSAHICFAFACCVIPGEQRANNRCLLS